MPHASQRTDSPTSYMCNRCPLRQRGCTYYGTIRTSLDSPDHPGPFQNLPVLPNLPYMPETISETPETIPDTSGIIRDLSEPFRDHPRHSRYPSLYYRHLHNIRDTSEQLSERHFFISSIHTQSKMLLSLKCVTRRVRIYADMYRNAFRYNEH